MRAKLHATFLAHDYILSGETKVELLIMLRHLGIFSMLKFQQFK